MPRWSNEADFVLWIVKSALVGWRGEAEESGVIEEGRLISGFQSFAYDTIILKKPQSWRWNLTLHHRNIPLAPNIRVEMKKMVPRGRSTGITVPKYRVWICDIHKDQQNPLHFIWCQRGLDLRDFSFLRDFVSTDIAKELNWA
mmetsp:Transcript_11184/g.13831  ORF Transcript_11184/g.13831 Transcript_11184/m.13831 type:complete len:143 (-) Transcript_11184:465-893(-)